MRKMRDDMRVTKHDFRPDTINDTPRPKNGVLLRLTPTTRTSRLSCERPVPATNDYRLSKFRVMINILQKNPD